ncbi:metal ABC transporter ATP-binding protein [Solobacterium moorei]|uniref:metal ABC transporter ATP-binding protein n=1 Tax=Solobacterium moorei TaxID=102148 RepID=UPI0028D31B4B|nr:metal ABC transporter ATP-binding protein [Solobacterium moorei]
MSYIHVEDLTVSYGESPVLWDVDVDIERNAITAIVGPNGAGKSTLLKCILGFIKSISGVITIDGKSLADVRKQIAYIPQVSAVNWNFPIRVKDVVLMGRYASLGWLKWPRKKDKELAHQALCEMGIEEFENRQISQLSGGQKQRVFIARALCHDADLIVMDEPLAGVDQTSEQIIMDKIKELQKAGKTIVCVHHDLHTLKEYFDHAVFINKYVIANGKIDDVLTEENIRKTYQNGKYNTDTILL